MTSAQSSNLPRPKHILELTTEEKLDFLNSFDTVFSDIDGVVWNLHTDIPGASEAYKALKNAGKKLIFVTNNSVRPLEVAAKRFAALNIEVDVQEIIHPAKNIVDYLKSINFNGLIYIIASEKFKSYLRQAGFQLIDGPTEIIEESFSALEQHIFGGEPVRAVVIDVDFNLSSTKIIKAHMFLRHPECILIAGATDTFLPLSKHLSIIGPGPFCKILKDASKKEVITLGKPGKELAAMTIKRLNIQEPRRNLMIGDMLEQDVDFGKACGFQTMLVLSGGSSKEDLDAATNPQCLPDYYADSVADFREFMEDIKKSHI